MFKDKLCNLFERSPACSENLNEFCSRIHLAELDFYDVFELVIVEVGTQEG